MSNVVAPRPEQLPSPQRLRRSATTAIVAAALIIVGVVLPAERGIDPTGIGTLIGLTEMGEFKVQAAKELAEAAAKRKALADSAEAPPATDSTAAGTKALGR